MYPLLLTLLVFLISLPAGAAPTQGTITLQPLSSDNLSEIKYTLEAKTISHALLGISATINLPDQLQFSHFEKGQFFERNSNNVTYLIAPKDNNPNKLLLGIATLGESKTTGSATIVTLYFKKLGASSGITQITDTVASGLEQGKRIDYSDIAWSIAPFSLAESGRNTLIATLMFSFIISLSIYLYILGKK
ncbi:MAG: hypothetical protein HY817_01355 [Candidatus Abawacabacteria bacterium]|nr:hypothetical protein [Candidatus Abawacabacteria bacterium]